MTIRELIARLQERVATELAARTTQRAAIMEVRTACETENRDPSDAEAQRVTDATTEVARIDGVVATLRAQIEDLEREQAADEAAASLAGEVNPGAARAGGTERTQRVEVTEPRTYTRESDPTGAMFLRDVAADFLGHRGAHRERLAAHEAEERAERGDQLERAVTTGGAPGLVVPQYLVDLYAKKGRPGRKFADQCRTHPLPATGMTVYIPRQVAKTTVGIQATENTTVSETDYTDETIPVGVRTAAGSQTIGRQSVDRSLGTEDIVFDDLMRAYDANLDSTLLNAATWGLLAVANTVTYTDASPTAEEFYSKIIGAQATAEDVLLDTDEDDLFTLMRGRRWNWLKNQMTDKWPFMAPRGFGPLGVGADDLAGYPAGVRGRLPDGGDVVTDNNLPANLGGGTEDVAVVVVRQEAHLWEDPSAPVYIRAEQTQAKKLAIDLVVYGYFAGCFDRVVDEQGSPKAVHQKITGTGLIAPTF